MTLESRIQAAIPGYKELTENEQLVQRIKVISEDFYMFCEYNLWIKPKVGPLERLSLNVAQKKLVKEVVKDLSEGTPVRYIVLKARQMGFSTVIEALCYWWATTHRYVNATIAAHEESAAENIYNMFLRYFENCHAFFKPSKKYFTKESILFNNKTNTGLQSQINMMTVKTGVGGRSQTNQFLHASEVAFWQNAEDTRDGLLQTVALEPETFIFLESTANGVGGFFYDEWQAAKKGEGVYKPMFFAWHEHPEYEMPGKIDVYDEEEEELLKVFEKEGYPEESWVRKLVWRRMKMREYRKDPKKFDQEYPKDDYVAFVASGRPKFDTKSLIEMEAKAEEVKPTYYELSIDDTKKVTSSVVRDGPLKVWEEPKPDEYYYIGVDVAEGLKHGDYSVIDVKNRERKTVARWRGHTDPDVLGYEIKKLGYWYNQALVAVEINNHGLTTVGYLKSELYHNLYMRERGLDNQWEEPTSFMGWRTDTKTKPLMIDELAMAIREGEIEDYDPVFIREAMTYVIDDRGRTNAQDGEHDDTVIASAICLQIIPQASLRRRYMTKQRGVIYNRRRR